MKHLKCYIILVIISFIIILYGSINNDFGNMSESSPVVTNEEIPKTPTNINLNLNVDTKKTVDSSNIEKEIIKTENTANKPVGTSDSKEVKLKIVVSDILLGGYENGNWIDSETIDSDKTWDNVPSCDFFVYGERGEDRTDELYESFGKGMEIIMKGPNHNTAIIKNKNLIGFSMPVVTDNSISYNIVNEFFSNEGLSEKYKINVTQAVSADLDGDRVDENIISVRDYNESDLCNRDYFACNNYSYLLLSKHAANNKNISIIDEASTYKISEDFKERYYGEIKDSNAISLSQFSIIGIVDINKDSVMEVITCNEIWEGIFYSLFEYKNGKLDKVLEAGVSE